MLMEIMIIMIMPLIKKDNYDNDVNKEIMMLIKTIMIMVLMRKIIIIIMLIWLWYN